MTIIDFEGPREVKLVLYVQPQGGHRGGGRVALLLPITLSQKVALVFGYKTTQSGVSDIRQIWNTMVRIQKDQSLEEVCSYAEEPGSSTSREASKITIDAVEISVEISQLPWWSGDSRNVFIDFSPVLNESGESRKGEFEGGTRMEREARGREEGRVSKYRKKDPIPIAQYSNRCLNMSRTTFCLFAGEQDPIDRSQV